MKSLKNLFKKSPQSHENNASKYVSNYICKDINKNIAKIKTELGDSSDLSVNLCECNNHKNLTYASIYIDNIICKNTVNSLSNEIIEGLKTNDKSENKTPEGYFNAFRSNLSSVRKLEEGNDLDILVNALVCGKTIFLVDGCDKYFSIDTFSVEDRPVSEPTSQSIVRGPKESFVENLSVNISLLRKRIKNKSLRVDDLVVGSITKTKITLMYIEKIAKKDIVDEIKRRLNSIKIDGILDSGYIEELIKDDRYSIFPTFLNSEKPDSVTAALLDGKVAILVDGSAFVLTAPALFIEFLQSSEDYYHQFIISSMIRVIRYVSLFLTLLVPAGFIALVTFHQEMIPTPLLMSIAAQREGIPFPAFVEALLMEGIFEILREAGIRMPRVIGPAISIVGALVLGQAAVEAGIISSVMVIIVSITAISSFAIPNYAMSNAIRVIRFVLMVLAGIYGLYGVFMGLILLTLHLCKLKSIGLPYMAPISPVTKNGIKDTIFRFPLWNNKFRPVGISNIKSPRVAEDSPVTSKEKENPEFR